MLIRRVGDGRASEGHSGRHGHGCSHNGYCSFILPSMMHRLSEQRTSTTTTTSTRTFKCATNPCLKEQHPILLLQLHSSENHALSSCHSTFEFHYHSSPINLPFLRHSRHFRGRQRTGHAVGLLSRVTPSVKHTIL